MASRKEVENYILKYVDKIAQGGQNKKLYEDLFKSMNDKEFKQFMEDLDKGKITLSVIVPNEGKVKVDLNNNLKVSKELGVEFFQHLHYKNRDGLPDYVTPEKYMVIKLPVKRVAQLLSKKISIPEDSKVIDLTTGAVTGRSQASKMTYPEILFLSGMGLDKTLKELLKYRGGDLGANNAMNILLQKQGTASGDVLDKYATGVVSSKTLRAYFNAMHIKINI